MNAMDAKETFASERSVKKENFKELKRHLRVQFNINLKMEQENAIQTVVVDEKNVFAVLPTGYGKSMIFEAVALQQKLMESDTVILLVVPLLSLMSEHSQNLSKNYGVETVLLTEEFEDSDLLPRSNFVAICIPEFLFRTRGKRFLEKISHRCRYFVIDEVHCLESWGDITGKDKAVFRESFSKLRQLFIYFKEPPIIIAVTATLTDKNVKQIKRHLNLSKSNCVELTAGPISRKIWFAQVNASEFPEKDVINWLRKHGNQCPRIVIFCGRIEDCSPVYQNLIEQLSDQDEKSAIEMFHSITSTDKKEKIMADLKRTDGKIRVVVATSALSMGVNISDCRYVIILGVPTTLEELIQKIGRCGRNDAIGYAIMYPKYTRRHPKTKPAMIEFCEGMEMCFRKRLQCCFSGVEEVEVCCNICSPCSRTASIQNDCFSDLAETLTQSSDCVEDGDQSTASLDGGILNSAANSSMQTPVRRISNAEKEAFSDGLNFLRYSHDSDQSYNLPYMESCITAKNFQQILKLLPVLNSPKQLVNLVSSSELVNDILELVQLTFEEPNLRERIKIQRQQTGVIHTMEISSSGETELWDEFHEDSHEIDEECDVSYWKKLLGQEADASSDEELDVELGED